MKLQFNMGMLYTFGYVEEVNTSGPIIDWHLSEELNGYILELLDKKITRHGRKYATYNITVFKKLNSLRKL